MRLLASESRIWRPWGETSGPSAADGGPEALIPLVRQAELPAANVVSVCAGITKVTRAGVAADWEAALHTLFPGAVVQVVPDFAIAFRGAIPDGVGVAALAGTGSVIYGEDGRGGAVRVGGRGWEFGDEGSGAWLTTEAVRRTLRAVDGLEEISSLQERVAAALGGGDAGVLGEAARRRAADEGRGFLVPLIAAAAQEGDREALDLFVGAAGWLGAQVRAAVERLTFHAGAPIPVATVGGLWQIGDPLLHPFTRVLSRFAARCHPAGLTPVAPDAAPVVGALRLASAAGPGRVDGASASP